MRKSVLLVLLIVLGAMPMQGSAQASVPAVDLQCVNSYQDNASGPSQPMGYIDSSYSHNNTTIDSPIDCTVTNPNAYAERIQIQFSANGLTISGPGTISLGAGAVVSFNLTANAELGIGNKVLYASDTPL